MKENAFINEPQEDAQAQELRRLCSENACLIEERDILKKLLSGLQRKSSNQRND